MAKIVIIAPAGAEDIDDAVKMLKGAGHDVDLEEPAPKTLLHIMLGLFGPNAYGFGSDYAIAAPSSDAKGDKDDDSKDDKPAKDDAPADDSAPADSDDFNFESLGEVSVDGELIEAIRTNEETSTLKVSELVSGARTSYSLNESTFSFWPSDVAAPVQRVQVEKNKHRAALEVKVVEGTEKPVLYVGKDLISIFE